MATKTTNAVVADELDEIRDELIELCKRARRLLRQSAPSLVYERARVYWLAHILAAAGAEEYHNPYDTTICTTIEELRNSDDDG